ncbi:MAG: hypothetical protein RBU29_03130 [bacterium]|jgi:hypothetical protein|nr:hypothetical protein [bacterium]
MNEVKPSEQQTKEAVAAVLDMRRLVRRCLALESERVAREEQVRKLQTQLDLKTQEAERLQSWAYAGRCAVEQKKAAMLAQVRMLAQAAGDPLRLPAMESRLADESLTPDEVERWAGRIEQEFHALYPTRPLSQPVQRVAAGRKPLDWALYRFSTE